MNKFEQTKAELVKEPRSWLVTGCAGFIGSNLVELLLSLGQKVVGLDNFATGHQKNLEIVRELVGEQRWQKFTFHEGCVTRLSDCEKVVNGVDYVLHQAALGSVPRSINDPINSNNTNINGFLNMLVASRDARVKRFVYAASSSTYGDHPGLPKVEDIIGKPLSPYAVTKYVNELYAEVFGRCYSLESIGLRYFNVFGRRQDPDGAYAAVIPKWYGSLLRGEKVFINGDGETSRDFCYIDNVLQANILAATSDNPEAVNQVYNTALGDRTTLNELYRLIRSSVAQRYPELADVDAHYREFRAGDVRHSQADITKIRELIGYEPTHRVAEGIEEAANFYLDSIEHALS